MWCNDKMMTVVLPCAGEGSRMALKTPKELYDIFPERGGVRLIDFSLAHIRAFQWPEQVRVAVVVRPWKVGVAEYVRQQLPGIDVDTVMFDDRYQEWPGSVYSAAGCFSAHNLVLLPDSCLKLTKTNITNEKETLIERMLGALASAKVVFGHVPCRDKEILGTMGAMRVENNRVTAFQDKPRAALEIFNGFWGCYGFRREVGRELYDFLIQSVRHEGACLEEQSFYPPGVIGLAAYFDLGTWDRIEIFREQMGTNWTK